MTAPAEDGPPVAECDTCGEAVTINRQGRLVHAVTTLRTCGVTFGRDATASYRGVIRAELHEFADHLAYGTPFGEDPHPSPTVVDQEDEVDEKPKPPKKVAAFDIIGEELPTLSKPVPSVRQAAIDWCKAHPGQWVRYRLGKGDEVVHTPAAIKNSVAHGRGGFTGATFECVTRDRQVYFRALKEKS